MIVDALMWILGWLVYLLPDWSPLGGVLDAALDDVLDLPVIGEMLSGLAWLDHYLPVTEGFAVLTLTATAWLAMQAYQSAMWVWRNLPGKAT